MVGRDKRGLHLRLLDRRWYTDPRAAGAEAGEINTALFRAVEGQEFSAVDLVAAADFLGQTEMLETK
jgi:hypothetical protein